MTLDEAEREQVAQALEHLAKGIRAGSLAGFEMTWHQTQGVELKTAHKHPLEFITVNFTQETEA